jgi:DNA invertase Pin-like site-specific DNA recombinase
MLKELIKSLSVAKAEVESLEAKVEKGLKEALATIHAEHGFDSVGSFIKAVKKASKEAETKGRKAATRAFPKAKRAKITAAVRATVKNLVKAGKSGAEIAKAVGISSASVQNVKKALGLVKQSKKKASRKVSAKKKASPAPAKRKAAPKAKKKRTASKKAASEAPATAAAATEAPAAPPAQ